MKKESHNTTNKPANDSRPTRINARMMVRVKGTGEEGWMTLPELIEKYKPEWIQIGDKRVPIKPGQ